MQIESKRIAVRGGEIAAWSYGTGQTAIFLHGGPGDTHHYMKRMAEPLITSARCIFFDQRGTGGSIGFSRSPDQFCLEFLLEDLIAVQESFSVDTPVLFGHSWGATYGLFACLRYPGRYAKAALLNIGPLDRTMERKSAALLESCLTEHERSEWQRLRIARNEARDFRHFDQVEMLDRELMRLRVKCWVYEPAYRPEFLAEYFRDPAPDREVNKWICDGTANWLSWDKLGLNLTPTWLCVGANDAVPVEQAESLSAAMPQCRLTVLDRCGHIPWLEGKNQFYRELKEFLGVSSLAAGTIA